MNGLQRFFEIQQVVSPGIRGKRNNAHFAPLHREPRDIANFTGRIIIVGSGNVKVYVGSSFNLSGQDQIVVSEGTSLQLYVAAPSAKFGGQGLSNMDTDAMSFQYYGLPTNTALTFSANASFTGTIYAPEADFNLGGGGSGYQYYFSAGYDKNLSNTVGNSYDRITLNANNTYALVMRLDRAGCVVRFRIRS